jgi:3-hydroxyanthranilate 3,4-dioxygenase
VVLRDGVFITEVCREGEMFWIPPLVPHLNQREEGSIGLVIHGQREPGAVDSMVWYCESCGAELHRMDYGFDKDLRALLGPRIREFQSSQLMRTCKSCGSVMSEDLGFM